MIVMADLSQTTIPPSLSLPSSPLSLCSLWNWRVVHIYLSSGTWQRTSPRTCFLDPATYPARLTWNWPYTSTTGRHAKSMKCHFMWGWGWGDSYVWTLYVNDCAEVWCSVDCSLVQRLGSEMGAVVHVCSFISSKARYVCSMVRTVHRLTRLLFSDTSLSKQQNHLVSMTTLDRRWKSRSVTCPVLAGTHLQ